MVRAMSGNLWAPWRMEYIVGPRPSGCVFCDAKNDLVIATRPRAFVCLNKYPFAAGHLLVVPSKHVGDLGELDAEDAAAFFELLRESVARLRKALVPDGVNVGINLGKAAGAGIAEHLHAHIVPRWNGDTNFMPVLADVRVMPEYLATTRDKLRPFFEEPKAL
jgi:ATP adenylyltransferase